MRYAKPVECATSFLNVPSPTVALLRSETSKVREDFLKALGSLRHELDIHEVSVSMASPEDVVAAIRGVREEVMVLIRGGGDDTDFRVFETPQVLAALGECPAFRLLGLGHSRNRTLADCIADHTANVPADAGRFLSERVLEARLLSEQTAGVAFDAKTRVWQEIKRCALSWRGLFPSPAVRDLVVDGVERIANTIGRLLISSNGDRLSHTRFRRAVPLPARARASAAYLADARWPLSAGHVAATAAGS
jgi:exonuclease VII large subunit